MRNCKNYRTLIFLIENCKQETWILLKKPLSFKFYVLVDTSTKNNKQY